MISVYLSGRVQRRMTPETARCDILKLIDLGLVETVGMNGPRYLYCYVERRAVQESGNFSKTFQNIVLNKKYY